MSPDQAVELCREAVILTLLVGAPVMLISVVVGLIISLFQAVTQLQEQTLSFVPKIVAMMLTVLFVLPWIIGRMVYYTEDLYRNIPVNL